MNTKIDQLVNKFKSDYDVSSIDEKGDYILYEILVKHVVRDCLMTAVNACDDPERMLDAFRHVYGRL